MNNLSIYFPLPRICRLIPILFILFISCNQLLALPSLHDTLRLSGPEVSVTEEGVQVSDSLSGSEESMEDTTSQKAADNYLTTPVEIRKFDRKNWVASKKGLDFSEKPPPKPKKTESSTEHDTLFSGSTLFSGEWVKFIFVSLIILCLAFLLYRIFSGRLSNKRVKNDTQMVSVEDIHDIEQVSESELERLLREALQRKDFREAIRVYYIFIIHGLSGRELIHWKKEKTNREYLAELSSTPHYAVFREITLLFDRVWYGDMELNEPDYLRISPRFKALSDTLKANQPLEK